MIGRALAGLYFVPSFHLVTEHTDSVSNIDKVLQYVVCVSRSYDLFYQPMAELVSYIFWIITG